VDGANRPGAQWTICSSRLPTGKNRVDAVCRLITALFLWHHPSSLKGVRLWQRPTRRCFLSSGPDAECVRSRRCGAGALFERVFKDTRDSGRGGDRGPLCRCSGSAARSLGPTTPRVDLHQRPSRTVPILLLKPRWVVLTRAIGGRRCWLDSGTQGCAIRMYREPSRRAWPSCPAGLKAWTMISFDVIFFLDHVR